VTGLEQIDAYLAGPWLLCALVGLGFAVGVLSGLFGVGGAFLLNPLLIVVLGLNESLVVGSGLSFAIGTGAAGMVRHMRGRNVEFRSMWILGVAAIVGTLGGTELHQWLRRLAGPEHFKVLILALYLAMLLAVAWLVYRDAPNSPGGRSLLQRLPLPPRISLPAAGRPGVSLPGLIGVGVIVGLAVGMLGIGGGVLFMPLLLMVVGLSAHQAVGTSLGVVLFGSISGTIHHSLHGNVSLWIAMSLLVGSSAGVQLGAYFCERLHARRLRRWFACVVAVAAVIVAVKLAASLLQ